MCTPDKFFFFLQKLDCEDPVSTAEHMVDRENVFRDADLDATMSYEPVEVDMGFIILVPQ